MGNSLMSSPQPKPITEAGFYGFNWQPNLNDYNTLLDGITKPEGLIIGFNQNSFDESYFGPELLYKLPTPSTRLKSIATTLFGKTLGSDVKIKEVQGFLDYTNTCLNYVYQTNTGKKLLNELLKSTGGVAIIPSFAANEIRSGSGALSTVSKYFLDPNWRSKGVAKEEVINILEKASNKKGEDSFVWLANTINKTPLYTIEDKAPYPFSDKGFLTALNKTVSKEDVKSWLTEGDDSYFAKKLQLTKTPTRYTVYQEPVSVQEFIRLAAVIALWPASSNGLSRGSTVSFNVRVSTDPMSETGYLNTQRPPAVGLAHELIHALHNQEGNQPGADFGANSTLLYELLCVGIGPWDGYEISENSIRAEWATVTGLIGYNNLKAPKRDVYIPGKKKVVEEKQQEPSLII